ncbi:hypothetical protein Baya_1515 [Bagarius yarrelli]|uniref:Uncharacterized protein n=1 Tax=Bagarius yarrelli TaxID=175774 RepID=A0A556TLB6_BAGYA|nr:hypothetical protein Baya_1515 [Bagarius yarrelli]
MMGEALPGAESCGEIYSISEMLCSPARQPLANLIKAGKNGAQCGGVGLGGVKNSCLASGNKEWVSDMLTNNYRGQKQQDVLINEKSVCLDVSVCIRRQECNRKDGCLAFRCNIHQKKAKLNRDFTYKPVLIGAFTAIESSTADRNTSSGQKQNFFRTFTSTLVFTVTSAVCVADRIQEYTSMKRSAWDFSTLPNPHTKEPFGSARNSQYLCQIRSSEHLCYTSEMFCCGLQDVGQTQQ